MSKLFFAFVIFLPLSLHATESLVLPPCQGDNVAYWHDCFGVVGSTSEGYGGEFRHGKFEGQGTYTFANGDEYVGKFMNGMFNGLGTYRFADGSKQKGYWSRNILHHTADPNSETAAKGFQVPMPSPSQATKSVSEIDEKKIFPVSSGTGFVVSAEGHIVTNNHVVDGCTLVNIHHKGRVIKSTVINRDPLNDLALLQGDFVPSSVFRVSRRNPQIMQEIFVAGYPFGNQISSSVKVTKGIVSSLTGIGNNVSNIQIDAALQPGNSGGPIFDNKGNVIGVAVAKLDLKKAVDDWGVIPENTNFGIKSNVVVNLLESNGIKIQEASNASLSNNDLGKVMSGATYHLSCWMTMAQARKMTTSKVMFHDLTQ